MCPDPDRDPGPNPGLEPRQLGKITYNIFLCVCVLKDGGLLH